MSTQSEITKIHNQAALLRYATLAALILFCMALAGYYGYFAGRAVQAKRDVATVQSWSHSSPQGVKHANT